MANKKKTENGDGLVSEDVLRELLSRGDFSYDVNADELYRKYRDAYEREGARAMRDTVGKAQTMTGGYGNSYAVSAGQAAYGKYLEKANEAIPELYRLAEQRYRADTDALKDKYDLLYGREQDAAAEKKTAEELAIKRAAQALAERKADDQRKQNEDKNALSREQIEARRENDRLDHDASLARTAASAAKNGTADPLSTVRYGRLGIEGVTDLQSLIGVLRSEAMKQGTLAKGNRYIDAWLAQKRADGTLTADAAEELRYYLVLSASDFPKNRGGKAREVVM